METTLYKNQTEELLIEAFDREKRNQLNEAAMAAQASRSPDPPAGSVA
jgi:hypothetical protein